MEGSGGEAPPPEEGKLAKDRCPSCGGKLTFELGRDQGFCPIEGIFVEVVIPPKPEATAPPLARAKVLQATKRELRAMCIAHGLNGSGNKTELLTRVLRYMDDRGLDVPPEEREAAEEAAEAPPSVPSGAEEKPPTTGAAEEEMDHLLEELAQTTGAEPTAPTQPAAEEVDQLLEEISAEHPPEPEKSPPQEAPSAETREEAGIPETVGEAAAETEEEAPAKAFEEETAPEVSTETTPTEEALIEEILAEETPTEEAAAESLEETVVEASVEAEPAEEIVVEEALAEETPTEEAAAEEAAAGVDAARLRRDRRAFYTGSVLVAVGGSGLVAGSFLHDTFRVPIIGQQYGAFGILNVTALLVGCVLLVAGIVAMGYGLRGGIARPQSLEAE